MIRSPVQALLVVERSRNNSSVLQQPFPPQWHPLWVKLSTQAQVCGGREAVQRAARVRCAGYSVAVLQSTTQCQRQSCVQEFGLSCVCRCVQMLQMLHGESTLSAWGAWACLHATGCTGSRDRHRGKDDVLWLEWTLLKPIGTAQSRLVSIGALPDNRHPYCGGVGRVIFGYCAHVCGGGQNDTYSDRQSARTVCVCVCVCMHTQAPPNHVAWTRLCSMHAPTGIAWPLIDRLS
jgi:hypothetical protein